MTHMKIATGACLVVLLTAISAWGFTVTTQPPENITATTLTAHGKLEAGEGGAPATVRGFACGTTPDPDTSGLHTAEEGRFGNGAFTGVITGLKPNTTYHVRAYAYRDPDAVTYGNAVKFTTGGKRDTGFFERFIGWFR